MDTTIPPQVADQMARDAYWTEEREEAARELAWQRAIEACYGGTAEVSARGVHDIVP